MLMHQSKDLNDHQSVVHSLRLYLEEYIREIDTIKKHSKGKIDFDPVNNILKRISDRDGTAIIESLIHSSLSYKLTFNTMNKTYNKKQKFIEYGNLHYKLINLHQLLLFIFHLKDYKNDNINYSKQWLLKKIERREFTYFKTLVTRYVQNFDRVASRADFQRIFRFGSAMDIRRFIEASDIIFSTNQPISIISLLSEKKDISSENNDHRLRILFDNCVILYNLLFEHKFIFTKLLFMLGVLHVIAFNNLLRDDGKNINNCPSVALCWNMQQNGDYELASAPYLVRACYNQALNNYLEHRSESSANDTNRNKFIEYKENIEKMLSIPTSTSHHRDNKIIHHKKENNIITVYAPYDFREPYNYWPSLSKVYKTSTTPCIYVVCINNPADDITIKTIVLNAYIHGLVAQYCRSHPTISKIPICSSFHISIFGPAIELNNNIINIDNEIIAGYTIIKNTALNNSNSSTKSFFVTSTHSVPHLAKLNISLHAYLSGILQNKYLNSSLSKGKCFNIFFDLLCSGIKFLSVVHQKSRFYNAKINLSRKQAESMMNTGCYICAASIDHMYRNRLFFWFPLHSQINCNSKKDNSLLYLLKHASKALSYISKNNMFAENMKIFIDRFISSDLEALLITNNYNYGIAYKNFYNMLIEFNICN